MLQLSIEKQGTSYIKNFKRDVNKLVKAKDLKGLKALLLVKAGYTKKLAECWENDFILKCINEVKQAKAKEKQEKRFKNSRYFVARTPCTCQPRKFYGIMHNL